MLEVVLWLLPVLAFSIWYKSAFLPPSSFFPEHLLIISAIVAVSCASRIFLAFANVKNSARRLLSILCIFGPLLALTAFYAAIISGQLVLGRVITVDLLASYMDSNFFAMLDALQVSVLSVAAIAFFFLVIGICLAAIWEKRLTWPKQIQQFTSRFFLNSVVVCLLLFSFLTIFNYSAYPPTKQREPFALSLFPPVASVALQSLRIDPSLIEIRKARLEKERFLYRGDLEINYPNVILIVVDGLRADRLGVLGHDRENTPFLSRLSTAGFFEHERSIYAVCGESTCGVISLLSSLYPHEYGAENFTLTEALKRNGFKTRFFLSGDHQSFFNLDRFMGPADQYVDGKTFPGYINDDSQVLSELASVPDYDGTPTYFHFHLMSAHVLGTKLPQFEKYQPAQNYAINRSTELQYSLNFYDNGILQLDWVISEIVELLDEKGYMDGAVFAVTADHGELLGEHGLWGHASSLYEQELRIPLLIAPSFGEAQETPKQLQSPPVASQIDLAPTIADMVGISIPSLWQGKAMKSIDEGRPVLIFQGSDVGVVLQIDTGQTIKFWRNMRTGEEFIYDLANDPGETNNLRSDYSSSRLLNTLRKRALLSLGTQRFDIEGSP